MLRLRFRGVAAGSGFGRGKDEGSVRWFCIASEWIGSDRCGSLRTLRTLRIVASQWDRRRWRRRRSLDVKCGWDKGKE